MSSSYKSARALEMAVKEAAKASSLDTGRAVSSFYFHRLFCRVFADGNEAFVLKGGQSMLARTLDARATRDIDLLSVQVDLDAALKDLLDASRKDLGDFVTFELVETRPIKANDEYRSGLSVRLAPIIGAKRMQDISVDLVVDQVPLDAVYATTCNIDGDRLSSFSENVTPHGSLRIAASLTDGAEARVDPGCRRTSPVPRASRLRSMTSASPSARRTSPR